MNESNNEYTDDEADLFDATLNKRNNNERKNDIYERFLQDIQSIGKNSSTDIIDSGITDSKTLEIFHSQPTYESLNEEELLFFIDSEEDSKSKDSYPELSADTSILVQDSLPDTVTIEPKNIEPKNTMVLELDIDETPTRLISSKKVKSTDNKRAGKLIVIGSLCGVLFIVIAVTLSATGLLSKFTDSSVSKTIPAAATEQTVTPNMVDDANIPVTDVMTTTNQNANETAIEEEGSAQAIAELTIDAVAKPATNAVSANDVSSSIDKSQEATVQEQPTISFEDFQRESQNTVYRDSND